MASKAEVMIRPQNIFCPELIKTHVKCLSLLTERPQFSMR